MPDLTANRQLRATCAGMKKDAQEGKHSSMAFEALEKEAEDLKLQVKVLTQQAQLDEAQIEQLLHQSDGSTGTPAPLNEKQKLDMWQKAKKEIHNLKRDKIALQEQLAKAQQEILQTKGGKIKNYRSGIPTPARTPLSSSNRTVSITSSTGSENS